MPKDAAGQYADVQGVIESVKAQIAEAANSAPHLELREFALELAVAVKKKVGGGFEFKIPLFDISLGPGGSVSTASDQTTKLTLTYQAPPPQKTVGVLDVQKLEGLPQALAAIEKNINAGLSSPPALPFKEGAISFAFGITTEIGGTLKVVIFSAEAKGSRQDAHTITLKFAAKQ